jgi:hypothetical protein
MLLYNIYYREGVCDAARALPQPRTAWGRRILRGATARCVNGDRVELRWVRGQWRRDTLPGEGAS